MRKILLPLFIPIFLLNTSSSFAACFDFNAPIKTPLKYVSLKKGSKDSKASGTNPDKSFWGAVRGEIDKPIQKVYAQLLDHYTIKDPKRVKLRVYDQDRPGFQNFHLVMVSLEVALVSINWEEEWGYVITEGTGTDPKSVVISYQKTTGTEYIPHLCGSIVLKSVKSNKTDVYLYEEVNALGKRSPQETVAGHMGTLATLRKQPTP